MGRLRNKAFVAVACALALSCCLLAAGSAAAAPRADGPSAKKSIIGGTVADPASWPFAAGILFDGDLGCGGSVIAPTKILTAAHCALGFDPTHMQVVTGRPNLADGAAGQTIQVVSSMVHPDYAETGEHDLAVLKLAQPTTAPAVTTATSADAAAASRGKRIFVAGWGSQKPAGGHLSIVLKQTTLRVLRARNCFFVFGPDLFIPQTMICAQGTKKIGKKSKKQFTSACRGDSGGPVIANTPSGVRQVGLVSFGPRKCGRIYPAVYARLSAGSDFIASAIAAP
jgi:secreted trypsin-like serine protease